MHDDLRTFMLRLATDLELLNRFVAAPEATAQEEGLSDADREVLFSGDQSRIYLAISRKHASAAPPPAPKEAAQQSTPRWVCAWTPWGWQWYVR